MVTRVIFGIVFIALSLLILGDMWNIVHWDWLLQQPWIAYLSPVALLYVGWHLVTKGLTHNREQWLQRAVPPSVEGKRICCSVRYGGDEYVYRGETFHGAQLDAHFGGLRLDLREAVINEDEEIDIRTFCGGVEIFVPSTVNVVVQSRSILGGVSNKAIHGKDKSSHTIHIVANNFMGGVNIEC